MCFKAQVAEGCSVYAEPKPGFYNMHDVRILGSAKADNGYFLKSNWPLWPKSDSRDFEKFIHYRQVVLLPA